MAKVRNVLILVSVMLLMGLAVSCMFNPAVGPTAGSDPEPAVTAPGMGAVRVTIGASADRTAAASRELTGASGVVLELVHETYPRIHVAGTLPTVTVANVRVGTWQIRANLLDDETGNLKYYGEATVQVAPGATAGATVLVYATGGVGATLAEGLYPPGFVVDSVDWETEEVTVTITPAAGDPQPGFRYTTDGTDPAAGGTYSSVSHQVTAGTTALIRAISVDSETTPTAFSQVAEYRYTTVQFKSGVFVAGGSEYEDYKLRQDEANGVYWPTTPGDAFPNHNGNPTWKKAGSPEGYPYYLYWDLGEAPGWASGWAISYPKAGVLPSPASSNAIFYRNQYAYIDQFDPTGLGTNYQTFYPAPYSPVWYSTSSSHGGPNVYRFRGIYGDLFNWGVTQYWTSELTAAYALVGSSHGVPAFQWYLAHSPDDDGVPIPGATGAIYKPFSGMPIYGSIRSEAVKPKTVLDRGVGDREYLYVVVVPRGLNGEATGAPARSLPVLVGGGGEDYNYGYSGSGYDLVG